MEKFYMVRSPDGTFVGNIHTSVYRAWQEVVWEKSEGRFFAERMNRPLSEYLETFDQVKKDGFTVVEVEVKAK